MTVTALTDTKYESAHTQRSVLTHGSTRNFRTLVPWLLLSSSITALTFSSNRILSKVQKSFWSCTHVSSVPKLHIIYQSTYFIEYFMQGNFKYSRIKKIHQMIEKITRIDKKSKIHCVLLSHEILSTKIHYTSIYIFYLLFISRQI